MVCLLLSCSSWVSNSFTEFDIVGPTRERVTPSSSEHSRGGLPSFWTFHFSGLACCPEPSQVHLHTSRKEGRKLGQRRYKHYMGPGTFCNAFNISIQFAFPCEAARIVLLNSPLNYLKGNWMLLHLKCVFPWLLYKYRQMSKVLIFC